jgi:hypothetical protein
MKISEIINEDVTSADLEKIENRINDLWDEDGVEFNLHRRGKEKDGESHFLYRVNDNRNKPPIKPEEIEDVFTAAHDFKTPRNKIKHMPPGKEAVIVDPSSRVNIPVVASTNRNRETKIIPKTVMRKKDFLTGPGAEKINLPTDHKKPEHQKFKGSNFDIVDKSTDKNEFGQATNQKDSQKKDDKYDMGTKSNLKIDPSRIGKF